MDEQGNYLRLSGIINQSPTYGHEVFGEKFYYATLSVPRLSGAEDLLPITLSERLMEGIPLDIGMPFGREIADLMLAVNRAYGKSDYIPCITWGRTARFASHLHVGDKVTLMGRFQSRAYQKQLADGSVITKMAYEVSVGRLTMAAESTQPAYAEPEASYIGTQQ